MASPVVTGSYTQEYEPYRKAINEIVYSKQKWQEGAQTGNEGLQTWAANNAQQYYNQLPTHLANQLRGMNYTDAANLLRSLGSQAGPSVSPGPTIPTDPNPFDTRVADLMTRLEESINQPVTSPYDDQISALLNQIAARIYSNQTVDPRTTPEYAAGKAAIDRQVADNIRVAQEALGASGFARSTSLAERAQDIAQAGTEYLETQLVPQIAQQLLARDQQGLQNSLALLQGLTQQQGVFDSRQQAQLENLGSLLTALTQQQGLFDTRQQTQFQNELGLANLDLNRQQLALQQQQAEIQNELARIQAALQRTQAFGAVSEGDATILGVPAGTQTFQAREAVAQRQFQLDMLNRQLEAERRNLERRIAAEAEQARLNRASSERVARINELLSIWQATGTAPPGLEAYGVQPGQPYNPSLTPGQQLDQLRLNQELKAAEEQERISQLTPVYQAEYSLDTITAQALISALDNPTLESALADIKAHENQLKQMGVNIKKLRKAVESEFNKQRDSGGLTINPDSLTLDMLQPTTVTQSVFGSGGMPSGW